MDLPKGVAVTHGARTFKGSIPDELASKLGVTPELLKPAKVEAEAPKAKKK